jgi:ubiquinone/menaquinone biosynthesis C-methylase UbiE
VQIEDAVALIRSAVEGHDGRWADLGAGRGTFTRALARILSPESRIVAVDRDALALAEIGSWAKMEAPNVTTVQGDFTSDLALPEAPVAFDGLLLANALHFVKEPGAVLARLVRLLKSADPSHPLGMTSGRVVLVEYDRRAASRWVPYPISIASLGALAQAAGLSKFRVVESRPSNYEGIIYCAIAETGV